MTSLFRSSRTMKAAAAAERNNVRQKNGPGKNRLGAPSRVEASTESERSGVHHVGSRASAARNVVHQIRGAPGAASVARWKPSARGRPPIEIGGGEAIAAQSRLSLGDRRALGLLSNNPLQRTAAALTLGAALRSSAVGSRGS